MPTKPEGPAQEPQVFQRGNSWFVRWPSKASVCCGSEREARAIAREDWAELERINAESEPVPNNGLSFQEYEQMSVPATPAPSQPAGAREFIQHFYGWDDSDMTRAELPRFSLNQAVELCHVFARQQTAAKDAEWEQLAVAYSKQTEELVAAERERDSLRVENERLRENWKIKAQQFMDDIKRMVQAHDAENAALKAGKDGQQ